MALHAHYTVPERRSSLPQTTSVACIAKGVLQLVRLGSGRSGSACRIVNKTGRVVVLRSKYKDVWEGEHWRLPQGAAMTVPLAFLRSAEPYTRLGAFVDEDPAHPLFINSLHLLHLREITLTLTLSSPSPSSLSTV